MDSSYVYNAYALCFEFCLYGITDHYYVFSGIGGSVVESCIILITDKRFKAFSGVRMVDKNLRFIRILNGEIWQASAFVQQSFIRDIGLVVHLSAFFKVEETVAAVLAVVAAVEST